MTDTIQMYVQPGEFGRHAGGRYPCNVWAAHKDNDATAAFRCALKWWFPSRNNGVLLYDEARAVTVQPLGENAWEAKLELTQEQAASMQFARPFQFQFEATAALKPKPVAKKPRRKSTPKGRKK